MRADQLLVERGLAATRSQAQRLIAAGARWRAGTGLAWRAITKNGDDLPPQAELALNDAAEARYVSRGGLKLEGALRASGLDVSGCHALDVGQSTGGFTDCLLRAGAASVLGVDVGHGQLHPSLRGDPRVTVLEKLNARELGPDLLRRQGVPEARLQSGFDLAVGDLSFISLRLVLGPLLDLLAPHGHALLLVKPQFELQPGDIGKGGVVRDAALYARVEQGLREALAVLKSPCLGWFDSPIAGGDGNREFFLLAGAPPAATTSSP